MSNTDNDPQGLKDLERAVEKLGRSAERFVGLHRMNSQLKKLVAEGETEEAEALSIEMFIEQGKAFFGDGFTLPTKPE